MTYDFEYKQGDVDTAGAVLSDDDGALDLTDKTVTYIMKDLQTGLTKYEISCTLGGTVDGVYHSAAHGGVTVPFTATETAKSGQFKSEYVITGTNFVKHVPSGNNYKSVMIWEKV
ncbi:MAG: hypothetical protein ABFD07_16540 [Methanobacterium sp.]